MAVAGLLAAPATSVAATAPSIEAGQPAVVGSATVAGTSTGTVAGGTVTLVTGDRVTLSSGGNPSVVPDPARAGVGFMTFRQGGEVYVMPSDAAPLVAGGRLDQQLFNVSALIESGYGERDHLPLIVTHRRDLRGDARQRLAGAGVRVAGELRSANGLVVRAEQPDLPGFWQSVVDGELGRGSQVWLDRLLQPSLADSVPQVGAPEAVAAGFDGTGATVAVLDTGVDTAHPDLAGKVIGTANFTSESGLDLVGHGTHVAATVAGTGSASIGENAGVAPGAWLLSGKVCEVEGCPLSSIIAGMEWAAGQGADVVNMSLSGPDGPGLDPVEQAVENLTASSGTLFVCAADNKGRPRTIGSPASADSALAVGAVDGADQLAIFSSQGPRTGDSGLKPDITAPGVDVTAARSQHSPLGGDDYTTLSGTSMATPHVAGGAAILVQRHPDWTPEQLKSALMGSATRTAGLGAFAQGAGRLEVFDAVNQQVTAHPPSVSLGAVAADTTPGQTVTRTVTYHNHGTASVTLGLTTTTLGPTGAPAPAGLFTLGAGSVTVPAGGEASVTLTTSVGMSVPAGFYTGWITAAAGGVDVQTPFGFERAARLTVNHIGRTGGDPLAYSTVILPVDGSAAFQVAGQPGPVTLFLPTGHYLITSWIFDLGPTGVDQSLLTVPRLDATGSHTLTLDARTAQPVSVTVPNPAARLWHLDVSSELHVPGAGTTAIGSIPSGGPIFVANAGPSTHVVGYRAKLAPTHYVPGPGGDVRDAPTVFHSAWFFDNRMPDGLVRTVTNGQLATVDARHVAHAAGGTGYKAAFSHPGSGAFVGGFSSLPFSLPGNRTERYYTPGNIRWETQFEERVESVDEGVIRLASHPIAYTAGSSQVQWWNRPAYGPALANPPFGAGQWVSRTGDEIAFFLPLFGDGDGHYGFPNANRTAGLVTLTRDGQILYERPYDPQNGRLATVPPDFGTYQLTATAQRGGPVELGTRVTAKWTFTSQTVNGGTLRLPIWSVRMTPPVDPANTAPAGAAISIPLRAAAQPASAAAGLRSLTVQYSVDDGVSWQNATVSPSGSGHVAQFTHPNLTGFVSLRAVATDWAGNVGEQEVIRAYRIG